MTTTPAPLNDIEADRWSVLFMKKPRNSNEEAEFLALDRRNNLSDSGKEFCAQVAEVMGAGTPPAAAPAKQTAPLVERAKTAIAQSQIIAFPTGVRADLTNEQYHAGPGVSKSGLWKLYSTTPAHYIGEVRKDTKAKAFGTATHMAVLEPHLLERTYGCLPEGHNGTTKEGKAATQAVREAGLEPIKYDEYQAVLRIRDKLHADPIIQRLTKGAKYEQSAYWTDPETGELCRCRPDIYNPSLKMMGDVKTARDAGSWGFAKAIEEYGYHVQDAFYSDGWTMAGGGDVDAFVFIAVESEAPNLFQIYELEPADRDQGRQIYQTALRRYADCKRTGIWPGYPGGVQPITRPKWAHDKMAFASEAVS